MKKLKTSFISASLLFVTIVINAQNLSIKFGDETKTINPKGSETLSFTVGGNSYFITKNFEQAVMKYYLESYNSAGQSLAETKLEVNPGVFNNTYFIDDVVGIGNKAYALVEHLDKAAAKNTLLAREIDNSGKVSEDEVEVMSMPFEKIMNSGLNHAAVSSDNSILAVAGELPYVKEQSAKIKIAVYDNSLKQKSEEEVTIPGEDTRNKNIKVAVGNDGTVYLIKQTMTKNGEIALAVYQYEKGSGLKEYNFEMTAPMQFYTYAYTVNMANELIISGTYYERKTMLVGDKAAVGIFYFTNKNKSEKVFKTFTLDRPVENLTARKILVNESTIFIAAEQYKEEKIAPPAGTSATTFDYSYNYTHKNEYIIAIDVDGNKKFELSLPKDFTVRDFDKQYQSAYFINNGKFTIVYNDLAKKYSTDANYGYTIPVLVQVTNDGLMQSPVVFLDKLKLPYTYALYPTFATQNADNTITILMKNSNNSQYVNLKIN